MSLQRYVRQLKPIQENKTDYVNKVQMLSEGSTEAAKEMEYLLVHVANGRIPPAKKKFKNLKPYAQKNGFKKPEDLGKKILQNAGLSGRSGSMVDAQPVNKPTWKGSNTTPKTDIIIDKKLGEEIIKSKRNDLDATFDKQSNDTMTPAKLTILQRSRSFYIRDELLKLGYDAIKTKEGYTLLRHHQFLPTELVKGRGIRNSTRRSIKRKGGEVEIARAAREPDERIDKLTGLPYDRQAGTAYIDVEDRSKRLPLQNGAEVNISHLRGSGAIAQLSDCVIALERNQQAEDKTEANTTRIRILKSRHTGEVGLAGNLLYDSISGRLVETEFTNTLIDDIPF